MNRTYPRSAAWILMLLTWAGGASGQDGATPAMPESFREPMPLFATGLGPFTRTITTSSREAQAFFDQGVQFMYAFTPEDASRSFREAQARDPQCAMCFWGEAWSWGHYLNGRMSADGLAWARAAIEKALALADGNTTPVERDLIEAMAVRYVGREDPAQQGPKDRQYSESMGRVYADHPEDLDAGTLYGESLMLLEPRRGTWDIGREEVQRIHRVLEGVLAQDIRHPGACHLYIHATESTIQPGKPEECAGYLGNAIPGASHINHMPSHTYNRIGRWADAVRANVQAWHSDLAAEYGEGFAIYPSHNLHMLLFAGSMAGQGALSIQAAKDYGKLVPGGVFYEVLALVRFGRFDEILALNGPPPESPIFRGFWDFGHGYAHLRLGDVERARALLDEVESGARGAPEGVQFRGHSPEDLLGVVAGILRGEILRHEGSLDDAIAALETAVEIEDGLRYDEPEPLNFSARHWLGAALLEADRAAESEAVYREELEHHPHNGWSIYGLEQALRAQGRIEEADRERVHFQEAWAMADAFIRASRY